MPTLAQRHYEVVARHERGNGQRANLGVEAAAPYLMDYYCVPALARQPNAPPRWEKVRGGGTEAIADDEGCSLDDHPVRLDLAGQARE